MARKHIKVSRRMLFTWFMLAGLIIFFSPKSITNGFQFAFARLFQWPLNIGRNISLSAYTQQPITDVVSRKEYNKLQNHLVTVTEMLNQEHSKVEKLSGLRNRFGWEGVNFQLASVISVSVDTSHCELFIDKGQNDGLIEGQFVLGNNSIIGRISDTSPNQARVRLITDPASKIEVKISGLEINSIMQGCGGNSAKILNISMKHNIKEASDVCTLKKPGLINSPMKTGEIIKCNSSEENPLIWDITVKPTCDIERLKDVAVIIINP